MPKGTCRLGSTRLWAEEALCCQAAVLELLHNWTDLWYGPGLLETVLAVYQGRDSGQDE